MWTQIYTMYHTPCYHVLLNKMLRSETTVLQVNILDPVLILSGNI